MDDKATALFDLLNHAGLSAWGCADISGLGLQAINFPRAISLVLGFSFSGDPYRENEFHELLCKKRREMDHIKGRIAQFCESNGIDYYLIPHGQNETTLLARFPHKTAATMAGLGWIGKNALLVTEQFGPRVYLSTVLIRYTIPAAIPVTKSKCGNCTACVDACPYGCVLGKEWHPDIDREELLEIHTCNQKRSEFITAIGHKHACGYCMLACPKGAGQLNNPL